jgi:integrase
VGTIFIGENEDSPATCTEFAQKPVRNPDRRVTFPVKVEYYDQRAKIYRPASNFPFYRVAFKVAGKRRMLTFGSYGEAKTAAEAKVKELHKGQQSSALTAKQAQDAITVRDMLAGYRQETGNLVSLVEMTGSYLAAVKQLPKGCSLLEAVRVYRQSIAAVLRKPLAEAVKEFCDARRPKGVPVDGKRSVLSPVYVQDTERQLTEFSEANPGADVCDLTKQHLDLFVEAHAKLSAKSRNHYRATLRMFFGWCQRRDFLPATHRLLEADGLRKEDADTGDVDYYRPAELRLMLDQAAPEMAVIIALQAFGGLRLQEALRLDWGDVWRVPGHVEISSAKAKTRSRRLVEINATLTAWLEPYRQHQGAVTSLTLDAYTSQLIQLRKRLEIPSRKNGLRHGFLTAHYALHQNENQTAAQAGTSPGMLFRHYRGLMARKEAEKWFAVQPHRAANIVPLTTATAANP